MIKKKCWWKWNAIFLLQVENVLFNSMHPHAIAIGIVDNGFSSIYRLLNLYNIKIWKNGCNQLNIQYNYVVSWTLFEFYIYLVWFHSFRNPVIFQCGKINFVKNKTGWQNCWEKAILPSRDIHIHYTHIQSDIRFSIHREINKNKSNVTHA